MNNEAILSVLNNLCAEARNSAHAIFGLVELHRNAAADSPSRVCLEIGTRSADYLLRSLDDLRELLSNAPAAPQRLEEFDFALCLRETVELLNLASGEKYLRVEAAPATLIVRKDREAVEQLLTRTLDAAARLTGAGELRVGASADSAGNSFRFTINGPNSSVAVRLADWLNAIPEQADVQNGPEPPFRLAVMLAGKRLRALGGTAEVVRGSGKSAHLAIHLHSQPDGTSIEDCPPGRHRTPGRQMSQPNNLNILITEDCDDSYALTEFQLRNENVWRARNGWEAIDIVKKRRFDVVFMDVHMPGMDGYTTIRAIRDWETLTANARTPIVILSSDDLETQRQSAAQSGCSGFLRKPMREPDLVEMLARLKTTPSLVC
jgi:CheY-like chemotaxis protein